MSETKSIAPLGLIEQRIFLVRGEKVMIDADLAEFFGVPTRVLNQAVKRNRERFPPDFMFPLLPLERDELITNCDRFRRLKHSTVLPHAFSEHGVIMAASVLSSHRAIEVSVYIIRAFVQLRRSLEGNRAAAEKLAKLERRVSGHDRQILTVVEAIRKLMSPRKVPRKRQIGFVTHDDSDASHG